jgi:hypothetical protein
MRGTPFNFDLPIEFFEKADAEPGKQRRVRGIASIETRDRQNEVILARGLDFSDFLQNGWFNDNHSKETDGILGYPDTHKFFRKGASLPTGQKAKADGHWVEGYLLDTAKADRIWELGKALQKTNRRLGLSVEGKIIQREGPGNRTIVKALVRNTAITNCPVNADSRMEILAKSLRAIEETELDKALGMGNAVPGASIDGPRVGMEQGAGQVLTPESLEGKQRTLDIAKPKKKSKKLSKGMGEVQAFAFLKQRLPNADAKTIGRLIDLTRKLKKAGKL